MLTKIGQVQRLMDDQRQNREFMADTKLKELEGVDERLGLKLSQAIQVDSAEAEQTRRRGAAAAVHR